MMQGPNVQAIVDLAKASGKTVIASGGVTVQDDLLALARYSDQGVGGAIVGKALYTGNIDLASAITAIDNLKK
ncbi:1-(5-phosphoribosyl)-5-[(5-phosphoribosylamino)methylideneamino] imidazole-4-carboxamide isomerase [compost metagenome]